jgi:SAM-dependent methyltransferase
LSSHYEDYPYPDPGLYPVEQVAQLRTDNAPRSDTWEQWFPGEEPGPKKVLVIGCGVWEAIAVAAQEPLLEVVGIDSSRESIRLARDRARCAGIANLMFINVDFMEAAPDIDHYDLVIASGVLHHVADAHGFVIRVSRTLKPGGLFNAFVYGDRYREFVPPFCRMLRDLGVERNEKGIAFVRGLIASLPPHHPVQRFSLGVNNYDAQIVDLWLHPYFVQYGADELVSLMAGHGLNLVRWLDERAVDYALIENVPPQFAPIAQRFATFSEGQKARVGQILSHADHKLAALFRKGGG